MPYVSDNDPIPKPKPNFSKAAVIAAEGTRVAFVTCDECGAAILLDPRDETDVLARHRAWHINRRQER